MNCNEVNCSEANCSEVNCNEVNCDEANCNEVSDTGQCGDAITKSTPLGCRSVLL